MSPVTIIGGYLGAGKTTLINHLLRHADGRRLAVLVNEFGELPIDEDLIEAEGDDIISIAGGCICCSFGDNLIGALGDLAALDPAPNHILIEASGVAIPGSIAASVSLLGGVQLNCVVVLADTETIRDGARDKYLGDTILRQLRDADMLIMTKTDLVEKDAVREVRTWLEERAAAAVIMEAPCGAAPPDVVLGPSVGRRYLPHQDHSDADFESVVLNAGAPVDAHDLAARLATGGFGVIRAKGYVQDTSGAIMLVQVVGGRFDVSAAKPEATRSIVCIGRAGGLDVRNLEALVRSA